MAWSWILAPLVLCVGAIVVGVLLTRVQRARAGLASELDALAATGPAADQLADELSGLAAHTSAIAARGAASASDSEGVQRRPDQ